MSFVCVNCKQNTVKNRSFSHMDEREEVDVLGPQELVHYHKLDPHLPRNGVKAAKPDGSGEQAIRLSQMQAQQREMLDEKRVAKFGSLSIGDWNQDLELIEVKSEKGKFWQTMGYSANCKKYLYPEEGIFLMEMNALEIWYQGIPLSIQQAYELLIPRDFSLEEYQTFAYLMRLGYVVRRHKQFDITEYEHRIKLYQQNSHPHQRARKKVQIWVDQIAKKVSITNSSDNGDLTDDSYYSSSSNNGSSLDSAGDLNTKVKQAEQDVEEQCASGGEVEDGSDKYSSFYSDGPVSQLSEENLEKIDTDFNYSVVDLLDYHQRHRSSGSEQNHKILKRKQSSWYVTTINGSTSGSSTHQITPTKMRKGSCECFKGFTKTQEQNVPSQTIEKDLKKGLSQKEKISNFQSSDLGTSNPSLCESSIDVDEFLLTAVKQIKHVKKCEPDEISNRPHSTWNFTKIHIPDIGFRPLDPKFTDMPVRALPLKGREISGNFEAKNPGGRENGGESTTSLQEMMSGLPTSESDRDTSTSFIPKKSDKFNNGDAPSNWMEYKAFMKKSEKDLSELLVSPVGHLWNGEVKPLVKPSDALSTDDLLKKLQVIQCAQEKKMSRAIDPLCKDVKIAFDVYLPDSSFKKTCPGKAGFHIVVFSIHDPVPDFSTQMSILQQTGTIPILFSIVENADVTFCCFRDVKIPLDVS